MKQCGIHFFISLFLLMYISVPAQVNLQKGLVAYYPFNGNANDESGNNHHPTVVKVKYTKDRFGKANSASEFNGKTNFIRIPNHPDLNFKEGFSISAWVMINDFYEGTCHGNRIIMKGAFDSDYENGNYLLTFDDHPYTNGSNCFTKTPDKKHQSFYGAHTTSISKKYITRGKWYLLTYSYDGFNATLYVDCEVQATGKKRNYNFSNDEDLFFGKMNHAQYPYWFNGLLDEVRIYNRPLSISEIKLLCSKKSDGNIPRLVCTGTNIIPAKFSYTITNCMTAKFRLTKPVAGNFKKIQWAFGDRTGSDKLSPQHTYSKTGKYKVTAITTSTKNCRDTFSTFIEIKDLHTNFVYTEKGEPGKVLFSAGNNKANYSWNFGDGSSAINSSAVSHSFITSGNYSVQLFSKNNNGCTDTVQKEVSIILPEKEIQTTIEAIIAEPVSEPDVTILLEKRSKEIIKGIVTDNDSITVRIYDNGIIDGDSITLVYNNKVILSNQLLQSTPVILKLKIEENKANNELQMYANNQGSIPPNTALMIIYDGEKRHELNVTSTAKSNGTITFTSIKYNTIF